MSLWGDMMDISSGYKIRKEDMEQYLKEQLTDGRLNDEAIKTMKRSLEKDYRSWARHIGSLTIEVNPNAEQWFSDDDALALRACSLPLFEFGGASSLTEMIENQGVVIKIEPGIKKRSLLPELTEDEVDFWESMPLRGEYIPKDKTIKLYPEEMHSEYNGERMAELLISTLVHEAMHAYFDREEGGRNTFPYVMSIEEPMAEFGMLFYLYKTAMMSYFNWAKDDVKSKRTCYRYGAALMDFYLNGDTIILKDLENYKRKIF